MADVKISQLPAATTPVSGTEELPLVQSGVTKKIALSDLSSISFGATGLTPATATSGAVVVAGTLDVNNGGTGLPTLTANNVILGNGTSTPTFVAPSTGGNVLTSNGTTWVSSVPATSGTVTSVNVSGGTTGLTTSGGPITTSGVITLAGTLDVDNGGTGLTAGTSGGVLAYTATGTLASSAALTQYGVVYGGGAGAVPVATAAGTTGQVLTATTSGAPSWAAPATSGTVTSVAMTVPSVLSISGSPITSSGTLALTYSGTALPVANGGTGVTTSTGTTNVVLSNSPTLVTPVLGAATATSLQGIIGNVTPAAGTFTTVTASTPIGTASGGTGQTSFTSGGVVYASNATTFSATSAFQFNGTELGVGITPIASTPVAIQASTGNTAIRLVGTSFSSTSNAGIYWYDSNNTTFNGYIGNFSASFDFYNQRNTPIVFYTNAAEQMRLTSAGLAVTGTLSATGNISKIGTAATGVQSFRSYGTTTSYNYIQVDNTGGTLNLGVNGSVGGEIATGTSAYATVFGSYTNTPVEVIVNSAKLASFTSTGLAVTGTLSATGTLSGGTSGTAYSFSGSAPATSLTLDSSGALLIGVTSSSTTLFQEIKYTTTAAGTRYINTSSSSSIVMDFVAASSQVGSITTSGSATLYNVTSDYRLKTVTGAVTGHGARIDALKPIEYTWNSSGSSTRGFLAHQFQEVYASSVTGTKDAVDSDGKPVYQAMQASTSEVIADLVAELQSLRARVAQLESKS